MTNLYYTAASGSNSSSILIQSDNNNISSITFDNVTLEISASKYLISGSSNYLDYTRVYIKSGSITYASFPLEETNIVYTFKLQVYPSVPPTSSFLPPSAVYNPILNYTFTPNLFLTSSSDIFKITGSNISESISQSFYSSGVIMDTGSLYTITISGSGQFYTSSIQITGPSISLYYTSSNIPLTASFSSSIYNTVYSLTAQTETIPSLVLTYSASVFPVSPTSSLDAWNTYLTASAASIINSGSSVYLLGGNLSTINTLIIPSTNLTSYQSNGLYNLGSLTLNSDGDGKLNKFPTIISSPNLVYISFDSNQITGSILNFTSSQNLQTFIGSRNTISGSIQDILSVFPTQSIYKIDINHNKITGSVPILSSSLLAYLDCSYNQLSGSINSLSESYSLQYLNCSNNALTGSIPSLSDAVSLYSFHCYYNRLSGSTPNLSSNFMLGYFNCSYNQMSGSISNLSSSLYSSSLFWFDCSYNALTGSIPSLSNNQSLTNFYCNNNRLSGSIPNLNNNINLETFDCSSNSLAGYIPSLSNNVNLGYFSCRYNSITGSIPNLDNNIALYWLRANDNQLTGDIPYLGNNINLTNVSLNNNLLTGYISGSISNVLENFEANTNLLSPAAVDAILIDINNSLTVNGNYIDLAGPGNSPPSAIGSAVTASLISKGWTVYTN
jgi:hypothetical protein